MIYKFWNFENFLKILWKFLIFNFLFFKSYEICVLKFYENFVIFWNIWIFFFEILNFYFNTDFF